MPTMLNVMLIVKSNEFVGLNCTAYIFPIVAIRSRLRQTAQLPSLHGTEAWHFDCGSNAAVPVGGFVLHRIVYMEAAGVKATMAVMGGWVWRTALIWSPCCVLQVWFMGPHVIYYASLKLLLVCARAHTHIYCLFKIRVLKLFFTPLPVPPNSCE